MLNYVIFDIGIIILLAALAGLFARKIKQPLIPAYILAGVLIGPGLAYLIEHTTLLTTLLNGSTAIIQNVELIQTFSEIGIAFLLFIVGLEVDLKRLKDVEFVSSLGAILQVAILFPLGILLAQFLGFNVMESLYLGLILVFSSTMVVLKILSDRRELETLHGRIIIGILLVQDALAIFALLAFSVAGSASIAIFGLSVLKGLVVLVLSILLGNTFLPPIFRFAAKSTELLFVTAVGTFFLYSFVFEAVGFSIAIGAFVAGISLGNLSYNIEIIGRVKPLRDFFATLFFVSLGMQLRFISLEKIVLPVFLFFLFVFFIKPIMIMLTTAFFGYKKRTSFLTGISLAQVSEFSLIIVAQGLILGHISQDIFSITIILAIITIAFTSYVMEFQNKLYAHLAPDLSIFEYAQPTTLEYGMDDKHVEYLLCGYNRVGYSILHKLVKLKKKFLVIDFNPQTIKDLIVEKIPCIYGDVGNPEVLHHIHFKSLKFVISTISAHETSLVLVDTVKRMKKDLPVFVTAGTIEEALELYDHGADYVILPHFLGGDHASLLLEDLSIDISKLVKTKIKHIEELDRRKRLGKYVQSHLHHTA